MKTLVPTSFGQCAQMSPTKINKLVIKNLQNLSWPQHMMEHYNSLANMTQ